MNTVERNKSQTTKNKTNQNTREKRTIKKKIEELQTKADNITNITDEEFLQAYEDTASEIEALELNNTYRGRTAAEEEATDQLLGIQRTLRQELIGNRAHLADEAGKRFNKAHGVKSTASSAPKANVKKDTKTASGKSEAKGKAGGKRLVGTPNKFTFDYTEFKKPTLEAIVTNANTEQLFELEEKAAFEMHLMYGQKAKTYKKIFDDAQTTHNLFGKRWDNLRDAVATLGTEEDCKRLVSTFSMHYETGEAVAQTFRAKATDFPSVIWWYSLGKIVYTIQPKDGWVDREEVEEEVIVWTGTSVKATTVKETTAAGEHVDQQEITEPSAANGKLVNLYRAALVKVYKAEELIAAVAQFEKNVATLAALLKEDYETVLSEANDEIGKVYKAALVKVDEAHELITTVTAFEDNLEALKALVNGTNKDDEDPEPDTPSPSGKPRAGHTDAAHSVENSFEVGVQELTSQQALKDLEQAAFEAELVSDTGTAEKATAVIANRLNQFRKVARRAAGHEQIVQAHQTAERLDAAYVNGKRNGRMTAQAQNDAVREAYAAGGLVTLKTDDGSAVQATYAVIPISELVISHKFTGSSVSVNADYPAELQPRNRESFILTTQVYKMARTLDPAMLVASLNLNQGAPVIRADGVVLNGNGRAMAIALAYSQGYDTGKGYRQYLIDHAADFGLTSKEVSAVKNPALVRVVDGTLDDILMDSVIHSTVGGSDMSGLETANDDAARLTIADFKEYDEATGGDLTDKRNTGFVGRIIGRLVKDNERARYYQTNGGLTVDAVERTKRALFALAYGDDGMLEKMSASTDEGAKNISNALIAVVPNFAKLNLQTAAGVYRKYETAEPLMTAVKRYEYVRKSEYKSVEQYFNQMATLDRESVEVENIMRFFNENKRNHKWIKAFLMNIITVIKRQGKPVEMTLVSIPEHKPLTLEEVIAEAIKRTNDEKNGNITLNFGQ